MANKYFIFDYLPSFYRDFLINENEENILLPLFTEYAKATNDAFFQAQQLSFAPYLDKCPIAIKEYYKIIDTNTSNYLSGYGYKIESDIIGYSDLYYDSTFQRTVSSTYALTRHSSNGNTYINFSPSLDLKTKSIYAKFCYKQKNLLKDIFGKLLNYQPTFSFKQYGTDFITEQENYRTKLLAYLYCSVNGQTLDSVTKSLSIFLGLKYAPFNAIVRESSGTSITLEDISTGNLTTISGNIKSSLSIGSVLNKYDILENDIFKIYDIYSDPARFTQYILANKSQNLLNLLNIDTDNNEKYAFLTYDSLTAYDANNLYWDMGNNTGISHNPPVDASIYPLPPANLLTNFLRVAGPTPSISSSADFLTRLALTLVW